MENGYSIDARQSSANTTAGATKRILTQYTKAATSDLAARGSGVGRNARSRRRSSARDGSLLPGTFPQLRLLPHEMLIDQGQSDQSVVHPFCTGLLWSWKLVRFSHQVGEAKCVRGPSVQSARRSAPSFLNDGSVLEQYVEHGEQAQRSNGGPIGCFDRQLVRNAG